MTIKQLNILGIGLAGLLSVAGCTDFDDYNEAKTHAETAADRSLWDNIAGNDSLHCFAQIVEKAGWKEPLQTPGCYTVWAPADGSYDAESLLKADQATVLRQFVLNHIALYRHPAIGKLDGRVLMLNSKSTVFEGVRPYIFGTRNLTAANLPGTNGLLHITDGQVPFLFNLYENLSRPQTEADERWHTDSVRNYLLRYETRTLDKNNSIPGPIVDGKQTYIDSVTVVSNPMLSSMRAYLSAEDSSYTFLMPNNGAWSTAFSHIRPYFNYINVTTAQKLTDNDAGTTATISATVNAKALGDSLTRRYITANLVFNNNDIYNRWMEGGEGASDTLHSTGRNKLSSPQAILAHQTGALGMSNGRVRIIDSLAMKDWETFAPEIVANARGYRARVLKGNLHNHAIATDSIDAPKSYVWVEPSTASALPELDIELPDVLSTTYNIYCIVVPSTFDTPDSITPCKPNRLNFELSYTTASGSVGKKSLLQAYVTDKSKVDTVMIGTFTFPVCYQGLASDGQPLRPNVKITSKLSIFNKADMNTYTRDLRIAAVVMRPTAYDEYLNNQKNSAR